MYALDPIDEDVLDRAQGKSDPTSAWARARYNWVTYLLVRFGQLSQEQLEKQFPEGIPMWADVQKTGSLSLSQVSCFDGTHKKCVIDRQGHDQRGSRRGFRFRCNAATHMVSPLWLVLPGLKCGREKSS